jgi:hypothetical protein
MLCPLAREARLKRLSTAPNDAIHDRKKASRHACKNIYPRARAYHGSSALFYQQPVVCFTIRTCPAIPIVEGTNAFCKDAVSTKQPVNVATVWVVTVRFASRVLIVLAFAAARAKARQKPTQNGTGQKIEKRHGSHPAHATRGCSRRGLFPCRLHVIIDHDLAQRRRRRGRRVLRHCRRKEKKKRRKTADDRRVSKTLTVHQRICLFPIFSPSVINNCPCLQSRSSPADRLYGHTRESIFAFCSLQELAAIVRISHNWQASVHKMRAIKGCAHVISYTCKTTNVHITAIIAFASHCACRLGHRVDQEAG